MATIKALGIMSGTSLDGADFVLVEISKAKKIRMKYKAQIHFSFPASLRAQLQKAAQHQLRVDELAKLHHELGRFYADCYIETPSAFKKAHFIGLHGQTVFHEAPLATLQIGEGSYLSQVSKRPVVQDFRAADLSVNGQGAPIATIFHEVILAGLTKAKSMSVHNLGGISNLSFIVRGKTKMSFDTGPANMLLDIFIQKMSNEAQSYDVDGAKARQGKVSSAVLSQMLQHEYFAKPPPKSCGREQFGEVFLKAFEKPLRELGLENSLATLTDVTAKSIADAYKNWCRPFPEEIIFCGGGAKNLFLLQRLAHYLPGVKISSSSHYGWPVESIEGAAFALLAACRIWKIPSNRPITTGAKKPVLLGKIVEV